MAEAFIIKVKSYSISLYPELGRGTFGTIYKGTDSKKNTIAAKRMNTDHRRSQLTQDYNRLMKLDHPNVLKILDVEKIENYDYVWIFMPFCEFGDLNNFYSTRDVSVKVNLAVMKQIAAGISYLHSQYIAHRDIKPGNILVASESPLQILLADFDFCKCLDPETESSLMTSNIGTLAFQAPEFFQRNRPGKTEYHRNVDVYAAGLTFLALLQAEKGKRLIPRIETPTEVSNVPLPPGLFMAICNQVPEFNIVNSNGPQEHLKLLIIQMISINPEERLSAVEVVTFLDKLESETRAESQDSTWKKDVLDRAYQEACAFGTTTSYRAKLDIVGQTDVGKTSLSRRLLGQSILEHEESTEGIATHLVKSKFYPKDLNTGQWLEATNDVEELVAKFNNEILMKYDDFTQHSRTRDVHSDVARKMSHETDADVSNVSEVKPEDHQTDIQSERAHTSMEGTPQEENIQEEVKSTEIPEMSYKTREQLMAQYQSRLHSSTNAAVDYSLQLWDFGGHTEFLATHHLFMNIESTTLILLDISKKFNDPVKKTDKDTGVGIPNTPEKFLHYWLGAIYSQARQKHIDPNIALVLTHRDMIHTVDRDHYIREYIADIMKSIARKPYNDYITNKNIFVIDNKHDDENDFSKLRSEVFKMVIKQRSWGINRPVRWLKLEAEILDKANERSTKHLELSEVKGLANDFGMNDVELQSFLNFHHTLGDFVYYSEHNLKDVVITDPQWLADMFKTLITSQEFIERKFDSKICKQLQQGRVTLDTLEKIWKRNHVQFLINLFQNFELLLPIQSTAEGDMFIIPCMLPHMKKTIYETNPFKTMVLSYNSELSLKSRETFQIGIFHRLLSLCSKKWKICAEDHLSYTDASFEVVPNVRLALTLQEENLIRTSVWCQRDRIDGKIIELVLQSRAQVKSLAHTYHLEPHGNSFLMLCPHAKPEDESICLVPVKEVLDPKTTEITLWSTEKCHIHKKDIINYETPSSDKTGAERTRVKEEPTGFLQDVPSLENLAMDVMEEKTPAKPHWGTCPIIMNKSGQKYIATVTHGEGQILKDPESDVSLHIPKGLTGVFWKCVHTDPSKINIPDEECIITPLVEIHHHDASDDVDIPDREKFATIIPHCIPNRDLWRLVKVRKWNGIISKELIQKDVMGGEGDYFVMEEQFITVVTQHFCVLGGTICERESCRSTLRIILVAKLDAREGKNLTTVKIKSFLCSRLLSLHDFRRKLLHNQRSLGLDKVEEGDLHLDPKDFDPKKAVLTMILKAAQTESVLWQPCEDDDTLWMKQEGHFQKESVLQNVIQYVPCPCKSINQGDPVAAMVVNIKTEGLRQNFDGRFDITARTPGDQEGVEQKISRETIQFTVPPCRGLNQAGKGEITAKRRRSELVEKSMGQLQNRILTDSDLLEVAAKLTNEIDIYRLGFKLGLKHSDIETNVQNNRSSVTMQAYHTLHTWFVQQQDCKAAFNLLVTALERCKLYSIIDEVLYEN